MNTLCTLLLGLTLLTGTGEPSVTTQVYTPDEVTLELSLPVALDIPLDLTIQEAMVELRETYPEWHDQYRVNEFDCSEMASFVYCYLTDLGFDAEIACKYNLQKGYGHAWVEVMVNGKKVLIEATTLEIRKTKHHKLYNQFSANMKPKSTLQYDWWTEPYIMDKLNLKEGIDYEKTYLDSIVNAINPVEL